MSGCISGPRLNCDIFFELFYHVPRQSDVAALMSTCATLWNDGPKHLLAFPVVIRQPSTLRSFCTFMLNNMQSRAPLLRQFYFMISLEQDWDTPSEDEDDRDSEPGQYPCMSQDLVSMLAQVFENTMNLEDLSMECPDYLFRSIDDECFVSTAIAKLERIRRFHTTMVSDVTRGVLSIARWSLVELDIVSDWDDARVDLFPEDLLWLVKQHSATLEKLTVCRGCLTNSFEEIDYYHPHPGHMSCPHLHTLVLRHLDEFEDVTILHDAFPALRHLELSFDIDWDFYVEEMREDATPKDGVVYPWDVLNRLCGAVDALYSLCGAYGANILEVYRIHSDKELLKRLRTVISDVKPTHLVLHTGGFHPSSQFLAEDIFYLLPKEGTKVTHLVLNMKTSALKGTIGAFLFALTELLRAHPVQFLILRFLKRVVYDQELAKKLEAQGSWVHRQDEDEPNEIVDALNERSMPSIIEWFFKADPALAHIVVDIENEGFDYWQNHNKDDGLQGPLMHDDAGSERVKALGLGLRDGRIRAFCDDIRGD